MEEKKEEKMQRFRSSNWSMEQKELLRDLVAPRIKIIDSKNNATSFIKLKNDAWIEIHNNMKAAGYDIPIKKLREQWNRMKMQARANIGAIRKEQFATGGGPCPKEPNEFDLSISSLVPIDFESDVADFDSDAMEVHQMEPQEVILSPPVSVLGSVNKSASSSSSTVAVEKVINKEKLSKRRRAATSEVGDEMIKKRMKQIQEEVKENLEFIQLRIEGEKLKLKNLRELHQKDLDIRDKELELLCLKIENEKNQIKNK